jgi:glycosyltransferase involved in cell wall biosynthesis
MIQNNQTNNNDHPVEEQRSPAEGGAASEASSLGSPEKSERDEPREPLVSVVIPCYNQAHFLKEAIESVLKQSYPHYEIVVVDDGSSDETSEVAGSYERVRLIRQENRGLAEARNTGIKHSEGDYLVFLDADDRLLPDALAVGVESFDSHPECAFVFGHSDFIAEDGSPLRKPTPPLIGSELLPILLSRSFFVIPGEVIYRRVILDDVGLFDPSVNAAADYDLYFRIMRRYPVYCHGKTVLEYRRHDANMTRNPGKMLKATIRVLRRQKGYAEKDKLLKEAYEAGISRARFEEYGLSLAREVRMRREDGEWKKAASGTWTLMRYYPGALVLLPKRHWVAREFLECNELLKRRSRKLRRLIDDQKQERAEMRRLREQKEQAELRAQELERQLQEIHDSEAWKLVLKLAHLRAKVGGR